MPKHPLLSGVGSRRVKHPSRIALELFSTEPQKLIRWCDVLEAPGDVRIAGLRHSLFVSRYAHRIYSRFDRRESSLLRLYIRIDDYHSHCYSSLKGVSELRLEPR